MSWNNHNAGAKWFVNEDGRIKFERGLHYASDELRRYLTEDDEGFVRTEGQPKTARTLNIQHGDKIRKAAEHFGVETQIIAGIIMCESGRVRGTFERDVVSERHESGFISWAQTPHRGSAGIGQQLLTTARSIVKRFDLQDHFKDPFGARRDVEVGDLIVPHWGIFFTAGYVRILIEDENTIDPIKLSAGYNAGGVYNSTKNPFRLRAYGGADRFIKHAAYANDWIAATK